MIRAPRQLHPRLAAALSSLQKNGRGSCVGSGDLYRQVGLHPLNLSVCFILAYNAHSIILVAGIPNGEVTGSIADYPAVLAHCAGDMKV
jgi:hypothetical protein